MDLGPAFAQRYVRARPGRALICGSKVYKTRTDRRALYSDAVGVDQLPGEGVDRVLDLEEPLPAGLGLFDHVECLSVLEHSPRPWLLAANIERLMVQGGTLHLSVPFVWGLHAYPSDYFRFSSQGVRVLFPGIEWEVLLYAHTGFVEGGKVPPKRDIGGHIYIARTEVLGFGRRA